MFGIVSESVNHVYDILRIDGQWYGVIMFRSDELDES